MLYFRGVSVASGAVAKETYSKILRTYSENHRQRAIFAGVYLNITANKTRLNRI